MAEGSFAPQPDRDRPPPHQPITAHSGFLTDDYLLHRLAYPQGIRCGDQDVVRWDSDYGQIEHQANVFSATLLMPLDDFRRQIDPQSKADLGMLSGCAERYRVSLIAAVLRWLDYTDRRAVLVVSRDGFILWARPVRSFELR